VYEIKCVTFKVKSNPHLNNIFILNVRTAVDISYRIVMCTVYNDTGKSKQDKSLLYRTMVYREILLKTTWYYMFKMIEKNFITGETNSYM
jgi:hypothetical protein